MEKCMWILGLMILVVGGLSGCSEPISKTAQGNELITISKKEAILKVYRDSTEYFSDAQYVYTKDGYKCIVVDAYTRYSTMSCDYTKKYAFNWDTGVWNDTL